MKSAGVQLSAVSFQLKKKKLFIYAGQVTRAPDSPLAGRVKVAGTEARPTKIIIPNGLSNKLLPATW
jgi:hypothetical protein